jgi:tetratricopeptide (TPR) repeat protein
VVTLRSPDRRSNAYAGKDQADRAVQDCGQVIRLDTNCADAFDNQGAAFLALGQKPLAAKDFAKARQVNPKLRPP